MPACRVEIYCALPKLEELVLIADPGATLLLLLDVCSAFQTGTTKLPMSGHWADSLTPPHLDAHCHDSKTSAALPHCHIATKSKSGCKECDGFVQVGITNFRLKRRSLVVSNAQWSDNASGISGR